MLRKYLIILVLVISLLACNDDNPDIADLIVSIRTLDKFDQPTETFIQGDLINMELTLTNTSSDDITVSSSNGSSNSNAYAQKFTIRNSNGDVVWSRENDENASSNNTPMPVDFPIVLNSLGSSTQVLTWDQIIDDSADTLLPIGDYDLEGSFPNINPETMATIKLFIR